MPSFYHFTSAEGLSGIIADRIITPGTAVANSSTIVENFAVCLTSDCFPFGHGIPDGREVSADVAERLGRSRVVDGKQLSCDHTKIRLRITIPENDTKLVYVPTLLDPEILLGMDVAGYFPCSNPGEISTHDLLLTTNHLASGRLERKSQTWWYYLSGIPFEWITEISVKLREREYLSGTPLEVLSALEEMNTP